MVKLETGSGRLASYERMGVMEQKIKQFIDRMIIENPGIEAVALANKDDSSLNMGKENIRYGFSVSASNS